MFEQAVSFLSIFSGARGKRGPSDGWRENLPCPSVGLWLSELATKGLYTPFSVGNVSPLGDSDTQVTVSQSKSQGETPGLHGSVVHTFLLQVPLAGGELWVWNQREPTDASCLPWCHLLLLAQPVL